MFGRMTKWQRRYERLSKSLDAEYRQAGETALRHQKFKDQVYAHLEPHMHPELWDVVYSNRRFTCPACRREWPCADAVFLMNVIDQTPSRTFDQLQMTSTEYDQMIEEGCTDEL